MLKTFALRGRELPITIYGPPGLRDLFSALRRIFGKLTYPYDLVELRPGDVLGRGDYELAAFAVRHGVSAVGYSLVEAARPGRVLAPPRPGRKVVIAGDTAYAESVVDAARGADLLVHEATFCEEERDRADETSHSTAGDAAQGAASAEAAMLAVTHLSPRYFGPDVADEARAIFPETVVPRDFDVIEVPFPERGAPRLLKGAVAPAKRQPETAPVEVS